MNNLQKAQHYLETFCGVTPNRRTGSPGNHVATDFFADTIRKWDYTVDTASFPCVDYKCSSVSLEFEGKSYMIYGGQFSPACDVTAELVTVSSVAELEGCRCEDNILLMRGDLCTEHLMPKNFIFYNPDHHKRIYSLLEEKKPAAIIAATEKNPELAGALYPFPLIEDGDFDIPSMYCTSSTGNEIALHTGEKIHLSIDARRIPATACNVLATKNQAALRKIVILAHIDAYWCTPGAVDNASGVTVLLLLAEMLKDYKGNLCVEIIAVNGEDYYSAGGEMDYLHRYGHDLGRTTLAVNIDGAGYRKGKTAYSLYECPDDVSRLIKGVFSHHKGLVEGVQWPQSDHSLFVQRGIPAIAMTTEEFVEISSTIAHTPVDTPDLIDCEKLVEVAHALRDLVMSFPDN